MLKLTKTYHWFAIYTMSRQEKMVHSDLTGNGFESYLPLLRTRRKWSDRIKWIDEPMFRGYVFVRVSCVEYYKILQHRSVMKYISFGGKPSVIPDHSIDALRRALGEGIDFEITSDRFKPGQPVEVTGGPMCGCRGEIVRYAGRKRLLVRIGETGYSLIVEMPAALVEGTESGQNTGTESGQNICRDA